MKIHPDILGPNVESSIKDTNEKSLQELNSFLDIATLHCNAMNVDHKPLKQLPRPNEEYKLWFHLKLDGTTLS